MSAGLETRLLSDFEETEGAENFEKNLSQTSPPPLPAEVVEGIRQGTYPPW